LHILEVDNEAVRKSQIERFQQAKRKQKKKYLQKLQKSLVALTEAAKSGKRNLLDLAIKAAKDRATLGEISDALEVVLEDIKQYIKPFLACIVKK